MTPSEWFFGSCFLGFFSHSSSIKILFHKTTHIMLSMCWQSFTIVLRLKITINSLYKVKRTAFFLRRTKLNGESMNGIKILESKQDLLKYLLTCERFMFWRIRIRATLFYSGKYSYKQIKLADPKPLESPNIMSNHHHRETALKMDNTGSLTRKSWILNRVFPCYGKLQIKQKNRQLQHSINYWMYWTPWQGKNTDMS